jgi:glycosyltransferase involved in cell wall biosynthesis
LLILGKFFDFVGAGLPIVAGGVRDGEIAKEIVANGCGIVVEPEDVSGLFRAIKKLVLCEKTRERMAVNSDLLALKYTREKQSDEFISVLEGILA